MINHNIKITNSNPAIMDSVLFYTFLFWFDGMFLLNDAELFDNTFISILIPMSILPLSIYYPSLDKISNFKIQLSICSIKKLIAAIPTPIFLASFFYVFSITFSTWIKPQADYAWLRLMLILSFETLFYLMIIVRLYIFYSGFIIKFFFISSIILSISAIINIYIFLTSLENIAEFSEFRMTSFLGHGIDHAPNSASLVYSLFFFGSMYSLFYSRSKKIRFISVICSVIIFLALLLSQSRGSIVGIFITILTSGILTSGRFRYIFLMISGAIILVFALFKRITEIGVKKLDNNRFEIWEVFLKKIKDSPIIGYGERFKFEIVIKNGEIIYHPHNMLIASYVLGGFIGFTSFVFLIFSSLNATYKNYQQNKELLPLQLLLTTLIAGTVDFRLEILGPGWHWIVFWLPIGLSIGCSIKNRQNVNTLHKKCESKLF